MNERIVFYSTLGLSLALTALSVAMLNPILAACGLVATMLSIVFGRLWPIIEAVLFRHTNIVEILSGYELSGDRASAIRKVDGKVISTAMAAIVGSFGSGLDRKGIENLISHLNFPFKLTLQVENLSSTKLLERLQTKRSMKEIELSKLSRSGSSKELLKAGAIKRELELVENDIKNMSTGSRPLRMAHYIAASACSESRFYSEETAKSRIRELASELGALTSSEVRVLSGSELVAALRIDSMVMI